MNDLKTFQYILSIAETGSITDAADALEIAQSALSRYILKTEKDLGVELFDRTTLPITLTDTGKLYVEAGKKMLDIRHQLEKSIDEYKINKNQELRIGLGPSRAPDLIPLILSEFFKHNPQVTVHIDEYRTAELAARLSDGREDLIITFLNQETSAFGMEKLFRETVELAVPKRFKEEIEAKMHKGKIDLNEIDVPFISLHEGQQLRNALNILTDEKATPVCDCDYLESAMSLARHGLGVTLAPSYWRLYAQDKSLFFYPVSIPTDLNPEKLKQLLKIINREIGVFYRKEQFLSDTEKAFIKAANKICNDIIR